MKIYYKIEYAHKSSEPHWVRSLYQGKPSKFDDISEAWTALDNQNLYPRTLQYRIVRVVEEVVEYHADNKSKKALSVAEVSAVR